MENVQRMITSNAYAFIFIVKSYGICRTKAKHIILYKWKSVSYYNARVVRIKKIPATPVCTCVEGGLIVTRVLVIIMGNLRHDSKS